MNKFAPMFGTNMRSPDPQYSKFPVILVHVLFWAAFLFLPLILIESPEERFKFLRFWGYQIVLAAIYFYLNFLVLIPKILLRKKLGLYILTLFAAMGIMMVITFIYRVILHDVGIYKVRTPGFDWKSIWIPLFPCVTAFGLSTFIRMTRQWMAIERDQQELQTQKLASELGFLKSQINPHFLFNTLNNICSLARKRSDETENALIKLSDIMRYMLDDSKEEKVFLSKEIEYLNNYIELQRLRLPENTKIDFSIKGDPGSVMIEPLLLIPFVENAFKHGTGCREAAAITLGMDIGPDRLKFIVDNRIFASGESDLPAEAGIGLKNVKRRLELLYPAKHELEVENGGNAFRIELTIRLR